MWGFKSSVDRAKSNLIFERIIDKNIAIRYNQNMKSPKGADQFFLSDHVYPLIVENSVIHDSFLCKNYKNSLPFPTRRNGTCHVAYMDNLEKCTKPSNEKLKSFECPLACRPAEHPDWLQC